MNKSNSKSSLKRFQNVTIVILSVIIFFSLCEITLRLIKFSVNQTGGYLKFGCFQWQADKYNIPKNSWDPCLFWRCHTKERFNRRRHSLTKPKNVYRIICLGDSTTQNFIKPNTSAYTIEETYPYMLEQALNRSGGSMHFEVINAGCGGYTSFQGLRLLKSELLNYSPDLLIVWFGINDMSQAILYSDKEQRFPNVFIAKVEKILNYSKFYQFYKQGFLYFLSTIKQSDNKNRVSAGDYHTNLKEIARFAKQNDVSTVFIIPFQIIDSRIFSYRDFASRHRDFGYAKIFDEFSRNGIHIIDMADVFKHIGSPGKYFVDICHANLDGNRIIAETVYSYLVDKKIIPITHSENYMAQ